MTTEILEAPNNNHNTIIEKERRKFSSEWIVIPECTYKGYRFDLMALNPTTKELRVIEVDIAHNTPLEKIALIESFANLTIIRAKSHKQIESKSFAPIMKTVGNNIRLAILDYLADDGEKTYSEIIQTLKMSPIKDAGRFAYHLKYLCKFNIIEKKGKCYAITPKGLQIIDFCRKMCI
jgi:DNA-binding HxlR family transcriptional regulator